MFQQMLIYCVVLLDSLILGLLTQYVYIYAYVFVRNFSTQPGETVRLIAKK